MIMTPLKTKHFLATALLAVSPTTVPALDITWPMTTAVVVDSPQGIPVDAIQSQPAGQPLIFGRPAPEAAVKRFQPSLQDGALVFRGPHTSHVPEFWKNYRDFTVDVDVTFDSVDQDQTLLRVTGAWEIRLVNQGGVPKLQFIGFRDPLKPAAAVLEGNIEAGTKYALKARMEADGSMTFESDAAGSSFAALGRPIADFGIYPELFVGSSNPERFDRALQGKISRLRITVEEAQ
jgi:hypothetical protein